MWVVRLKRRDGWYCWGDKWCNVSIEGIGLMRMLVWKKPSSSLTSRKTIWLVESAQVTSRFVDTCSNLINVPIQMY